MIHHTDCGMLFFTNEIMRELLAKSLETAAFDGKHWRDTGRGPGSREGDYIEWLAIKDQQQSVLADVERLRSHPLVPSSISIYGYVYDVKTGKLLDVAGASRLGKDA